MKNYLVLALALTLGFSLHAQKKRIKICQESLAEREL